MTVVKANSQVWPNLEERHMLQLSGGSEEKDCKQVSSSCPAHPSTFHWRWHRGERSTYNFSKHIHRWMMMITWWAWLHKACWWLGKPQLPLQLLKTSLIASSHYSGRAVAPLQSTMRWRHQNTSKWKEGWTCTKSNRERNFLQVLDFMAEDFQQKWDQMHRSINKDDGLTKVRNDDMAVFAWSTKGALQIQLCGFCP